MAGEIFDELNEDQAEAVAAARGAVCILAGAGSGKTTTITRRIANQVATGAFLPEEILAVTFTEKAAREMAARLARLGVRGVRARTFHAEALAQWRRFTDDATDILDSKGRLLAPIVARLRPPYRFVAVRDVATEIEWAKNRRVPPDAYPHAATGRRAALPPDLMAGVFAQYERAKARARLMDFEDLIARTVDLLQADQRTREAVRARYRAFTVDEYQDVNLLQQELLDAWAGDRDDVCVVGDDYQSIFGFTGATPRYLLEFPRRYPDALVVRLTASYRSTPQVLATANRLVPRLGGSSKALRAVRPAGPDPVAREHATGRDEVAWIVARARALHDAGTPWEEIAVLYRINGRSEDLEEALSAARVPYRVRDGAFLRRPAARAAIARLRRAGDADPAAAVERTVRELGLSESAGDEDPAPEEATRQADLARLLHLAREFHGADVRAFLDDLARRFAGDEDGRGVQVLTYHRAKGLEFDAVFLPRLEEKEIPFALARTDEEIAEERRVLYVGITRAKRHLFLSWARSRADGRRRSPRPSPFLEEVLDEPAAAVALGVALGVAPGTRSSGATAAGAARPDPVPDEDRDLFLALKEWRLRRAQREGVPAYVVFNDRTLAGIAGERPRTPAALRSISGVGPAKLDRYGEEVLTLVAAHPEPRVPAAGGVA